MMEWQAEAFMRLRETMPWAGLVISLMLGLFYYWFAIANRYVVFLYEHLGAGR
jgi:hypothetical protein